MSISPVSMALKHFGITCSQNMYTKFGEVSERPFFMYTVLLKVSVVVWLHLGTVTAWLGLGTH